MRGDKDAAEKAFLETTQTVAVLVAGAAGFCMAGPPLAVFCSVGVGVQWNLGMIRNDLSMESKNMEFATLSTIRSAWTPGLMESLASLVTESRGGHLVKVVGTTTLSSA